MFASPAGLEVQPVVGNATMKYSLRSLMIVVTLGPPLLAGAWYLGNKLLEKPPRRESFSLGGPVTPRIIIQPEDEARLGLNTDTP